MTLWVNTKRVMRAGFVSFWRNSIVSIASVLIMTVTLSTLGLLFFMSALLQGFLEQVEQKVDINIYFTTRAPEENILALQGELEKLSEVESVAYVSREDALRYAAQHGVPVLQKKDDLYSRDGNLWHLSHEGGPLEDPAEAAPESMYRLSASAQHRPALFAAALPPGDGSG